MEPLYEAEVGIRRTVSTSGAQAWALADRIRRLIARILYRRTLTTSQIVAALAEEGVDKSYGTIRHHIALLVKAGVIEIARVVAVRGTVEKSYTTATKVLEYTAPDDFDRVHAADIRATARKLEQAVDRLAPKAANRPPKAGADPGYEQFVIAEILNRAMTRVFEARYEGGKITAQPAAPKLDPSQIPSGPGKGRKAGEPRTATKHRRGAAPRAGRPKAGADKAAS